MAKRDSAAEVTAPGLARLPPGRHGLSREFVTQNQRDRLTAGMIATVAKHGYHDSTITQIAEAAGVSRRTFYGYFSGKEECYFTTYQVIADHLQQGVRDAATESEDWPTELRLRLGATLEFFAANPDLVRFAMIAPQGAGGEIAERYRALLNDLLDALKADLPKTALCPSAAAEQGLIGAVAALIVREVRADRGERLSELLPDLAELVLTAYLGHEGASHAVRS